MKLLLGLVLAALMFVYRSFGPATLDGSAWDVRIKRMPLLPLGKKDTLVFERGRFTSARSLASGYFPSGYDSGEVEEGAMWEAHQVGDDGSVVTWRGRIDGDRIKGTLIHRGRNGREKRYSFKGRRKAL
jgi:hypothetical protein